MKIDPAVLTSASIGRVPYKKAWELQRALQKARIAREIGDLIIFCEHDPVITLGTSGKEANLLVSQDTLKEKNVELFNVERGGDVTYHGPGQLVLYPIIDLSLRKKDVGWYMRSLEEVVIDTLKHFKVEAHRIDGKTGVWINERSKIASLGVRISRWCSMHGIALNIKPCDEGFSLINPCGFTDIRVTSLEQERDLAFDVDEVAAKLQESFVRVFAYKDVHTISGSELVRGISIGV